MIIIKHKLRIVELNNVVDQKDHHRATKNTKKKQKLIRDLTLLFNVVVFLNFPKQKRYAINWKQKICSFLPMLNMYTMNEWMFHFELIVQSIIEDRWDWLIEYIKKTTHTTISNHIVFWLKWSCASIKKQKTKHKAKKINSPFFSNNKFWINKCLNRN